MSSRLFKLNIVVCNDIPNETILHVHYFMTNVYQIICYHNIIFQRGGDICPVSPSPWNVRTWTKWCRGVRRLMFIILLYRHTMRSKYTKYYYSIIVYIYIYYISSYVYYIMYIIAIHTLTLLYMCLLYVLFYCKTWIVYNNILYKMVWQ